ncbi:MAG: SDR family oxidoreductase [Anaerolineales bacterium]|nr:SDR family oxidoreductase [Anaerolineales bacterium]
MIFDFHDQVILVTGAAGNLGQAVSFAFYAAGGSLVLVGRWREKLVELFNEQIPEDERGLYVTADLSAESSVAEMVRVVLAHYGRIDILVNVAGGFTMGTAVHETAVETWDFMLNLNARTTFLMSRAVIPSMLAANRGKIVNVAARAGLAGKAKMAPYVISKSAVIRLTESMAAELKDHNINVNCILPGTIDTPRNRADMPKADFSKWVSPAALADVILFLASDAARDVHGAALPVYGCS